MSSMADGFRVVVVRAWVEPEGVRIRLLADGHSARRWVVDSVSDACDLLGCILEELEPGSPGPQRPG